MSKKNRINKLLEDGILFEDIAVECDMTVSQVIKFYTKIYNKQPPAITLLGFKGDFPEPNKILMNNDSIGVCPKCRNTVVLPCYACYIKEYSFITSEALDDVDTTLFIDNDYQRLNNIKKFMKCKRTNDKN